MSILYNNRKEKKDMEKNELKECCIKLLSEGKTISEIARQTSWSRKYIANLLKDDERYIQIKLFN